MRALLRTIIAGFLLSFSAAALADAKSRCEALSAHGPAGTVQITATLEQPGFNNPDSYYRLPSSILHFGPGSDDASTRPAGPVAKAFCRVSAVAPTQIRFEVWLPVDGWNGRLLGVGNGAMAGAVPFPAIQAGMEQGYATVGSDLGHEGPITDSSFSLGHPELLVDWGHRATHVMTEEAKKAVRAFYGKPQDFAYFAGCSGGGRQAMMEAQRYPADYNGILAGDPIMNFTKLTMAGRLWAQLAMYREANGAGYIPATKIPTIAAAVIAACDKLDGVADGIIRDPRLCRFDPATIRCKASDGPDCLTDPQVAALRKIYAGAHDSKGRPIFSGYSPGGEVGPGGWAQYLSGDGPYKGGQWMYASGVLPVLLYGDPKWDVHNIDYDKDPERAAALPILGEPMGEVIDAWNPDLSAFTARGGRLIHYHGWSDPGVPPLNSIAYYDRVVDRVAATQHISRDQALAKVQASYRLFVAPGMQHCTGGPGPDRFDGLTPLQNWVEKKQAPDQIRAVHVSEGKIDMSRPLCPYPLVARWTGKGSTSEAANFVCRPAPAPAKTASSAPPGRPVPPG
jgi:feruloyl esterase